MEFDPVVANGAAATRVRYGQRRHRYPRRNGGVIRHGRDHARKEGIAVTGWPVATMLRGQVVVRDRALAADRGIGALGVRRADLSST